MKGSWENRMQNLAAALLLDCALSAQLGCREAQMHYESGAGGKPYLPSHPEFHFSISHSGDVVLCAVSDREIGADIEKKRAYSAQLARRYFEQETAWETELGRLWVLKESYGKMRGTGLRALERVFLQREEGGAISAWEEGRRKEAAFWSTQELDGCFAAVCCEGCKPLQVQLRRCDFEEW